VRAAGIVIAGTAGGGGPGCETILFPPAIYDETYTAGVTAPGDVVASFSGRGPVTTGQGTIIKPDVVAPGVDVLSCLPDGEYAYWSGGAMANAHVAGAVALVVTAAPELAGNPGGIEGRLNLTAVPLLSSQCSSGGIVPNNVYGHGRVDMVAACGDVTAAPSRPAPTVRMLPNEPNPFNPRTSVVYELGQPGPADLRIFDTGGRLLRVLVSETWQEAGQHTVIWDGRDERGHDAPAGVYLSRLRSGDASAGSRLVLIR